MRHLADPAFIKALSRAKDGSAPVIIASWDDCIRDVARAVDGMGVPSNLVLPRGEAGLWLFRISITEDEGLSLVRSYGEDTPIRDLIKDVWERGRVTVCVEEPAHAQLELELDVAA